jgi:inhibitor of KinA sporulation pathway (predicted exonuclease)
VEVSNDLHRFAFVQISAFFDTLSYNVKSSVFPKYQNEIIEWCRDLLHIQCNSLIYSTHLADTYARVIRYVLKHSNLDAQTSGRRAVIYVAPDFDNTLKRDLLTSISNIKFETIRNDVLYEDRIDSDQLSEVLNRDLNDQQSYPLMVIASAGKFQHR